MKKLIICSIIAIIFTACSVSVSLSGGSVSPDSKTFSVYEFENIARIVNPSVAPDFTEKLKEHMEQNTNLDLVGDDGDLHFEGKIVGYNSKPVAITTNNDTPQAAQSRFTLTIEITFKNKQTPKNDFKQKFSFFKDFSADLTLDDAVTEDFIEEVYDNILEDIYNKAIVNW